LPSNSRRREMRGKDRHPHALVVVLVLLLLLLIAFVPSPANSASTTILITAVYYDTYLTGEPDEAFRLLNVSGSAVDLTNWTVTDGPTEGTITLSDTLAAGASIWIAREADDFTFEFGFAPDYEYGAETDPTVPNLTTSGSFALANSGDQVILKDAGAVIVDSVVYEDGDPTDTGWSGPGIYPYGGDTVGIEGFARGERGVEVFGKEGQVLYRKLDQATGLPVADTDTAADWAQATAIGDNGLDPMNGKKVHYPGWDLKLCF
jgi:hypothetical protein